MASYLHYQVWSQSKSGELEEQLASGTFVVGSSMSAPVAIPKASSLLSATERRMVALVKVIGADQVYLEARTSDGGAPSSTGAHAAQDSVPRQLFAASDGTCQVRLPVGGNFGAVLAAALT